LMSFLLDWSPNHLLNPLWHPHARYHSAILLFLFAGVAATATWLLWRRAPLPLLLDALLLRPPAAYSCLLLGRHPGPRATLLWHGPLPKPRRRGPLRGPYIAGLVARRILSSAIPTHV
jgi:hypothetical protein